MPGGNPSSRGVWCSTGSAAIRTGASYRREPGHREATPDERCRPERRRFALQRQGRPDQRPDLETLVLSPHGGGSGSCVLHELVDLWAVGHSERRVTPTATRGGAAVGLSRETAVGQQPDRDRRQSELFSAPLVRPLELFRDEDVER